MRRFLLLGVVAALLCVANAARAQDPDPFDRAVGRPVASVRLEIEDRPVTAENLVSLVEVKIGEPLTIEALRRSRDRLASDPRFQDVVVLFAERPGGIELVFRLVPRHPVDDIDFEGDPGLDPNALEGFVREQYGGVPTSTRTRDVEETVTRILAGEGYRSATAVGRIVETHNPDRATLVLTVTAGPRTTIRNTEVTGESPFTRDVIVARTGTAPGQPFRELAIAGALARLRSELRDKGYYAAVASYTPPPDGTEIDLTLRVHAGPLVELTVEPASHLPRGRTDDYIPIKREGSIDEDLLDDSRDAIRAALQRDGYWKAVVQHSRSEPGPGQLRITFRITRGLRYRIERVELPAELRLSRALVDKEPGLVAGAWFRESQALGAISRLVASQYVEQGYYVAHAEPKFDERPGAQGGEGGVVIHPNITEGPRATIREILFDLGETPIVRESEARAVTNAAPGTPYVRANIERDVAALGTYYASRGFQPAIAPTSTFNETGTEATVRVVIREGPQIFVGDITVVGNERISRETILREISLQPGQPYSDDRRLESQRILGSTGSFRSARIIPEPRLPGEHRVRITISVQELPANVIGGGGGIEVGNRAREVEGGGVEEELEFAPRAFFEIGRRNIGGRNRDLSFFTRVALKAQTIQEAEAQGIGFNEYRVTATYRERYAFRSATDMLFGITAEQAVRPTFSYVRQAANGDALHYLTSRVSITGRYALEFTKLFDRIPDPQDYLIDRFFPQLRLSTLSSGILWNRRNDAVAPTRGFQLGANGDLALPAIGSEAGFVKGFFQGSYFYPLREERDKRLILATRGQVGVARGFPRFRTRLTEEGQELQEEVQDVPANYRFFAGGTTTIRGFQLDRLGVPEILTVDGLSNGGNAEVILNAELRATIWKLFNRDLTTVAFLDGGQVYRLARDLDLGRLRGSGGFGLRYDSPLGPIRLDVGFKMNRITYGNGRRERGWEYHISIGEAF
jgi:outer membrane protein assembly factor BamA